MPLLTGGERVEWERAAASFPTGDNEVWHATWGWEMSGYDQGKVRISSLTLLVRENVLLTRVKKVT